MITRLLALPGLTLAIAILPSSVFAVNDGTYKTFDVKSPEECRAICEDDLKCRGWTLLQPDTRYPDSQCSLNDGLAAQTPFPATPPEPLDMTLAEAELNAYRAQYGLNPVTLNAQLIAASQVHSDDLAQMGAAQHEGSDGSDFSQRAERIGYTFRIGAENVATGQKSWDKAFEGWKNSPGHNANLLLPDVTEFGIALTYEPTTTYLTYWTMVLGAPL